MVKYNIEGGADFYAELYKSLDNDEDEKIIESDNNICLITNLPLTTNYVVMDCGHKFNYIPIYKDILNHKQKYNLMELGSGRLKNGEIRCPYCRKIQSSLLPFYEELGLPKVNGVNFYDPNVKQLNNYNTREKCSYKFPNENFDPSKPESDTLNPKYLNINCTHCYTTQIQLYSSSNPTQFINFGDENYYCYGHKKTMIKYYKMQQKQKAKDDLKLAKQKAKEIEKQKAKEEKQKLKEEKQKAKELIKNKNTENIVIGSSNVAISNNGCTAILKTGPNKGKYCGCVIKPNTILCGRHYKLENNIINNN